MDGEKDVISQGENIENPVAGLRDSFVNKETGLLDLGAVLSELAQVVRQFDPELDLAGIQRTIISSDYSAALKMLGKELGREVAPTQRGTSRGIAMLVATRDFDILVADSLLLEMVFLPDGKAFYTSINMLHHELCHAHDHLVKRKDLAHEFLAKELKGKRVHLNPMAMCLWDEYYANRRSYPTLFRGECIHATLLSEEILHVTETLKQQIALYRFSHDINALTSFATENIGYLFQLAGYVLGSLAGEGTTLEERYPEVWSVVSDSPLGKVWERLRLALDSLHERHGAWGTFDVLLPVEALADEVMKEFGLEFEERPQGLWVNVPYRTGDRF